MGVRGGRFLVNGKPVLIKGVNRHEHSPDTGRYVERSWMVRDVELMKLLLSKGADPKINTVLNVSPLHVAAGIGWVEGITYEWSPKQTAEAVKMLIGLGLGFIGSAFLKPVEHAGDATAPGMHHGSRLMPALLGVFFIILGISIVWAPQNFWPYIGAGFLILLGIWFIARSFGRA